MKMKMQHVRAALTAILVVATAAAAETATTPPANAGYQQAETLAPKNGSAPVAAAAKNLNQPIATNGAPLKELPPMKPYRTFITIQRYSVENNGEPRSPISNVRIELLFPTGKKVQLPEGGQWWPIGNGQVQEINRTFELPFAYIQKDAFKFVIQMYRKGSKMNPCNFEVTTLSEYNRAYVCHTDLNWQNNKALPPERVDKEGVQIRIFTDLNSKPNEIPTEPIALR